MTGNNLAIVGEQGRRTVRACMDAKEEHPEQRDLSARQSDRGRAEGSRHATSPTS